MKKIRFYHWWAYNLYYRLWTPILKERPEMAAAMTRWTDGWLEQNAKLLAKEE